MSMNRVAVATLNYCTGCIVNRLGTIVAKHGDMIEVLFDNDTTTNFYFGSSKAIIYL